MNGSLPDGQKILKEIGSSANATKEDIHLYAEHLGIVLPDEQNLLWIAQAGLEVSLPPPWCPVEDPQGRIYYYNSVTKETKWEHPLDSYYKAVVKKERLKACARTTTAESNVEDSGASLMSSLDDIPPLSSFAKASEVERTVVPFSRLKKGKKGFLSKSCPTNLHMLAAASGALVKASLVQQTDTDSESHTATLRNQDEPAVMRDLLTQKQALEFELERLKREVHKYQRIRDQLKASAKQELIQLGTSSLTHRSQNHRHAITDEKQGQNSHDKEAAWLGDSPGTKTKGESSKTSKGAVAGSISNRSSLGHKDLLRLSQRLSHLRHRHLQLSLRAAQQVAEDALASYVVPHTSGSEITSKDLVVSSIKLVPSSSTDLVPHRTARALTDIPHVGMGALHETAPTHYLKTYMPQQHDGRPPQQWSRSEWTTKLSQLRWSLRECELQQLLIK
ncbi:centrosomal protein 164 isoform X2 [Rhipicephalus microplus]|uniref:centrosomal protein 164 isoform X2 n=1 Tax=Rhipicephalus microplus TaxID=6941 RepID=UPI003F6A7B13